MAGMFDRLLAPEAVSPAAAGMMGGALDADLLRLLGAVPSTRTGNPFLRQRPLTSIEDLMAAHRSMLEAQPRAPLPTLPYKLGVPLVQPGQEWAYYHRDFY